MGKRQSSISFFATTEDLRAILAAIEAKAELQYVECGLFEEERRNRLSSLAGLASLGRAAAGDSNRELTYLVSQRSIDFNLRAVAQRRGGTKYAVDQMSNPHTIVFRPGGTYSDTALIAGMLGTVNETSTAKELMKLFSQEIRNRFERVKDYWVGPDAFQRWQSGVRLTSSISAPSEFDLRA
jgi:hypothetical protein